MYKVTVMTSVKMNHETDRVLVAISAIAATLLAAGTVAAAIGSAGSDQFAFAHHRQGYYNSHKGDGFKGISQQSITPQHVICLTAGGDSPITTACSNTATTTESNKGGIIGLGYNKGREGEGGQGISQQSITPQKTLCLTAGTNSKITKACSNESTTDKSNTGGLMHVSMR